MVALDQEAIVSKTAESLAAGIDPLEIIEKGLLPGLNTIGELCENKEYLNIQQEVRTEFKEMGLEILPSCPLRN